MFTFHRHRQAANIRIVIIMSLISTAQFIQTMHCNFIINIGKTIQVDFVLIVSFKFLIVKRLTEFLKKQAESLFLKLYVIFVIKA